MKYQIQLWSVQRLSTEHSTGKLNLNPPYQRNNIWTEKSQKILISSMKDGLPLPTFFLHQRDADSFDVADGQQRIRAILAYIRGDITDNAGKCFLKEEEFLKYLIPIVIIDPSVSQAAIREFYVMVNNTGLRLNKPELTKAAEFDSDALKLVEELATTDNFKAIGIFTEKQTGRMVDREFIEELVAQLRYGIGDKKNDIRKLYNEKLDKHTTQSIKDKFKGILSILVAHNEFDLAKTRYSQRNDFYTLFGFIDKHINFKSDTYKIFFKLLKAIQDDISPSNESSAELQFYALNCVSQSNSKAAREDRLSFFEELLVNESSKPNKLQKSLLKYYKITLINMVKTPDGCITIEPEKVQTQFKKL